MAKRLMRIPGAGYSQQDVGPVTGVELVAHGWTQTSRAYRQVARLPDGETALQALARKAPTEYRHLMEQAERSARATYMRGDYAMQDGNVMELTPEEFEDFLQTPGRDIA
jgi:hypothetical protein